MRKTRRRTRSSDTEIIYVNMKIVDGKIAEFQLLQPQNGQWAAYRKSGMYLKKMRRGLLMRNGDALLVRRRKS